MQHLRAVRMDKHVEFMQQHKTGSCFVSAKTGDQVHSCFTRVVADLAGVALTKNQLESDTVWHWVRTGHTVLLLLLLMLILIMILPVLIGP